MKRLQRLGAVRNVMRDAERRQAARLAEHERRFSDAQTRMQELQHYRSEYSRQLDKRALQGMNALTLRDYQYFMARLDAAMAQQAQVVARVAAELEFERLHWRDAAVRLKSTSSVLEKWESDERVLAERRAQFAADELALQQALRSAPDDTHTGSNQDG